MFCRTGRLAGATYEFTRNATVGRAATNTIVLDASTVSQLHARISFDAVAGRYVLEDLGSRNGTYVDGMRVARPTRLGDLHVISFSAKHDFIFQAFAPSEARTGDVAKTDAGRGKIRDPREGKHGSPPPSPVLPERPGAADELATRREPLPVLQIPKGVRTGSPPERPGAGDEVAATRPEPLPVLQIPKGVRTGNPNVPVGNSTEVRRPTPVEMPPNLQSRPDKESGAQSHSERVIQEKPSADRADDRKFTRTHSEPVGPLQIPEQIRPERSRGPSGKSGKSDAPVGLAGTSAIVATADFDVRDEQGTRIIRLSEGRHILGRSPESSIRLTDKTLSREHAAIVVEPGRVTVTDLGSQNGTFLGPTRVSGVMEVQPGVEIALGKHVRLVMRAGANVAKD